MLRRTTIPSVAIYNIQVTQNLTRENCADSQSLRD
jgi:hypothetical protein